VDAAHTGLVLAGVTAAGWVDAVVGGGGLLLIPTLLLAAVSTSSRKTLGSSSWRCSALVNFLIL